MSPLHLSALVTLVATAVIVVVGMPLAWLLARGRFRGHVLLETTTCYMVIFGGARVTYAWSVEGGVVNYDTHGDPYDAPREF